MSDPPNPELDIFSDARRLPAHTRDAFLDQACAGNAALRQNVEELLRLHEQAGGFLEAPPGGLDFKLAAPVKVPLMEKPGDRIGRYKLLQQIGEGGCGIVYMAEQEEPVRRRVALKVIKLGMDTKSVIARFEAERQALALMDHPNIARVLDAGATETGRPYFVMELVRGTKITEHCDQNNLSTRERLDLFIQVCQAIQHAHQKGVIHRDIKPSNILVTMNDGAPLPKVIDFGIAKATHGKLTDQTVFTAFEQFLGTPAYMSPEQAEMSAPDIDTRSDVYSLGVLLYELLTGQTPFDAKKLLQAGLDEIRRTIREEEPARPSTRLSTMLGAALTEVAKTRKAEPLKLIHLVRGDLDWIVMKALEKNRSRRYQTANGFAADIQRHLANEPVLARPPSNVYKFQRFVRRNKLVFVAGSAVIAALIIGFVVSTVMFFKEQEARRQAEVERKAAETEAAKSREIARFFKETLHGASPFDQLPMDLDRAALRAIVDRTAARIGTELTNQPEVEAEIRATLASTYSGIGEWDKAVAMYREVLRLRKAIYGETNKYVADALVELAGALEYGGNAGNLAEAEALGREGLAMTRKTTGAESVDTANALDALSNVLENSGKGLEAETLEREALAMNEKFEGTNSADIGWMLTRLADVLMSEAKFAEAEPLAYQALALQRKFHGENGYTWDVLHILLLTLDGEGKLAEQESLYRELWENYDLKGGGRNMSGLTSIPGWPDVLIKEGKLAEAEKVLRQAVALTMTTTNYPDIITTLTSLAGVQHSEGNLDGARSTVEEAINICTNHEVEFAGWQADDILRSIKDIPLASGSASPLEPVAAQFLQHQRMVGDPHDPYLVALLSDDASLLAKGGHASAARPLAEEAMRRCLDRPMTGNHVWMADNVITAFNDALPDPDETGELETNVLKLVQAERVVATDSDPHTALLLAEAADIFHAHGQSAEAQSLLNETKALRDRYPKQFQGQIGRKINKIFVAISRDETKTNSVATGLTAH